MTFRDPHPVQHLRVALVGNPNSGKTTLFNELTGLRQKVGNYPGVTVEKKEGRTVLADGREALLLDLPGVYSLTAFSPDEVIAADILLGRSLHTPAPDVVLCIADATNLERNLYLVSQVIDQHVPVVLALNMMDVALDHGITIDASLLERELGIRVVPTVASKGIGIADLQEALLTALPSRHASRLWPLPDAVERECEELIALLQEHHRLAPPVAFHEAVGLLSIPTAALERTDRYAPELLAHVRRDHQKLDFLGFDRPSLFVEHRYAWIRALCSRAVRDSRQSRDRTSDRLDRFLTHRIAGILIFLAVMAMMFQSIFSLAAIPMEWIGEAFDRGGSIITGLLPPGDLRDLLVHGALAGVAAVVTFLPQILLMFFFIGLLEDTGYMARAAYIMDRVMSRVGLHGKSFIPLLSSFACAIPGIMATRTIENPRDRLATMLVAPLMSCSARLPVYTLMIAAFVPPMTVLGILSLPGLVMLSMYALGIVAALGVAWILKVTLLKRPPPIFLIELPPYKVPSLRSIGLHMTERAWSFLKKAGTIILGASILLWFLATYPRLPGASPSEQLQHSFAGRIGRFIEPAIRPLGFDWRIGIGLVSSLLQREVFVSTMGTIYSVGGTSESGGSVSLRQQLRSHRDPITGRPAFTALTALCVMVYYVLAMQCLSTVAVMRRETGGWKWPLFQIGYMTALAYGVTWIVYRAGLALGLGG